MVGPSVKRDAVAHLRTVLGLSELRACSLVNADRKMVRYKSRRPADTELRARLRDLANERKRVGYRRLFILLCQEGNASGITASTGSTGKTASRCESAGRGGGRSEPAHRGLADGGDGARRADLRHSLMLLSTNEQILDTEIRQHPATTATCDQTACPSWSPCGRAMPPSSPGPTVLPDRRTDT
jgi:hypothetical protein